MLYRHKVEAERIPLQGVVRVKVTGHILKVRYMKRKTSMMHVKRLSKTEYILTDTGEVRNYKQGQSRGDNYQSLRRSIGKVRDLINANFEGGINELMFTLTYRENMQDSVRLYRDFKAFWKRYRYAYGQADYLAIAEPQRRGAWHMHVLIRHKDQIYVPTKRLEELWRQGFVKVKRIDNVNNLGGYFAAYLGDIDIRSSLDLKEDELSRGRKADIVCKVSEGRKKAIIKGGRLRLYPPGFNLYRCSRGIKHSQSVDVEYCELKGVVGGAIPNYSTTVEIMDDNQRVLNSITYEEYNLKKLKSQQKEGVHNAEAI